MSRRIAYLALAAELTLFSSGCSLFRRKPKPPPAPPPIAAPAPEAKPAEPAPPPGPLPEPPAQVPPAGLPPGPPAPIATPAPKLAPPPPRIRRRAPAAPKPVPEEAPPPPPAARLGEVLSEKRRAELSAQLDVNLTETRRILGTLSGRALTPEQSQAATRARAFLDQALGQRNSDLITAAELSRRALLLAQSLK